MDPFSYFGNLREALASVDSSSLVALARTLHIARQEGRTVCTCGNGGSASNASHLAQDLGKGTMVMGAPPLHCICLNDNVSSITAWANDTEYANVYSAQLFGLGPRPNDVLIAISGSGNSPNILMAVHEAHGLGMRTWGITGFDGGTLVGLAHRCVHVKCNDMGLIESAHSAIFHWLVDALKEAEQEGFVWSTPNEVLV
jgi:D-sedoheptulose 7-phosphate isomerase